MYPVVCAVCKNKFYNEEEFLGSSWCSQGVLGEELDDGEQRIHRARTSTPIAELESSSCGFADSVTDFFYQTWKSGLHSNDTIPTRRCSECWGHPQPVYYPQQFVFFNTIIYQTFAQYPYVQPVGFRPDGTFGVLPMATMATYWGYS